MCLVCCGLSCFPNPLVYPRHLVKIMVIIGNMESKHTLKLNAIWSSWKVNLPRSSPWVNTYFLSIWRELLCDSMGPSQGFFWECNVTGPGLLLCEAIFILPQVQSGIIIFLGSLTISQRNPKVRWIMAAGFFTFPFHSFSDYLTGIFSYFWVHRGLILQLSCSEICILFFCLLPKSCKIFFH